MRYLRILYFGPDGREIRQSPVSSARMPGYVIPATREKAAHYASYSAEARRHAAAATLLQEIRRRSPSFVGVAFLACPSRSKPPRTDMRRYMGTWIVMDVFGKVTRGDVAGASYVAVRRMIFNRLYTALFGTEKKATPAR